MNVSENHHEFIAWAEGMLHTHVTAHQQALGDSNVVYKLQSSTSNYFLKIGHGIEKERERLDWLQGKQPVAKVLGITRIGDTSALLLTAIEGETLKDVASKWGAEKVIDVLVSALHHLHATDIHDCPFGVPENGNVLVHGDASLPNFIVKDNDFSGYIDLEDLRMDNRDVDLAAVIWSLEYNFGSGHGTLFLKKYGIPHPTEEIVSRFHLQYEKMMEDWARTD